MNLPKNATSQRLFVFAGANDDNGFDSFSDRSHGDFSDPFPAAICFVWYRSTSFFRREIQWREREREGATVSRWKRQASVATEVMARREARLLGANFGCLARLSGENEVPRQLEMLLLRDPPPLKFC